jgi:hypothetical protein
LIVHEKWIPLKFINIIFKMELFGRYMDAKSSTNTTLKNLTKNTTYFGHGEKKQLMNTEKDTVRDYWMSYHFITEWGECRNSNTSFFDDDFNNGGPFFKKAKTQVPVGGRPHHYSGSPGWDRSERDEHRTIRDKPL